MATTSDLGRSITEMSDGELIDLLKSVRASRRVPKKSFSTPGSIKKPIVLKTGSLTNDQRKSLIAELEGML